MYNSIQTIKIENYIYFLKYINLASCLYVDHDFYISVFKLLNDEKKLSIQEQNKANFLHINKNKINLYKYAYVCLNKKVKAFTETNLNELVRKFKFKNEVKTVNETAQKFNNEILEKGLKEGFYENGQWYSRETVLNSSVLYSQLLAAMNSGFSIKKYAQAIDSTYTPQLASEVERFFEKEWNKNVMLLRKEGYEIKTAFDYYTAIEIVSTQKQLNNTPNNSRL